LWVINLGLVAFDQAHAFQRAAARLRARDVIQQDLLILCEHPAVVTTGRSSKAEHLLASASELDAIGIELRDIERGGDVTVHEPGQLVGYPIIKLTRHKQDLHWYLRQVEESLIAAVSDVGIPAERQAGQTGVWIGGRKLASIGVHAREWVTSHGFALNAHNDLSTFQWIVPCGIADVVMTSVSRECERRQLTIPGGEDLRALVVHNFARIFTLSARTAPHEIVNAVRAEAAPISV
jgi:lipoate-protein ligase B